MESIRTAGLVINAPAFYADPAFIAWLNNGERKFSWHIKGNAVADEYSDVVVGVDPGLSGEGSDSDMPGYIWDQIVAECKKHFAPGGGNHIMVRLTNLAEAADAHSWTNYYRCACCGDEWQSTLSSKCDDNCPSCDKVTNPYISDDGSLTIAQIEAAHHARLVFIKMNAGLVP